MQVAKFNHTKSYESIDELLAFITKSEHVHGICPGSIQLAKSWKSHISTYLISILIVFIAMLLISLINDETLEKIGAVMSFLPTDENFADYVKIGGFVLISIYMLYKGISYKPDLMIITTSKLFLLKEILYNKNTKRVSLKESYKIDLGDVKVKKIISIRGLKLSLPKNYTLIMGRAYFNKANSFESKFKVDINTAKEILKERIQLQPAK